MKKILAAVICILLLSAPCCGCGRGGTETEDSGELQGYQHANAGAEQCDTNAEEEDSEDMEKRNKYAGYAQWGQEKLYENYWNGTERSVYNTWPDDPDQEAALNYWWKAHAADAMIDGYERTGEEEYADRAESIIKNTISRNGSLYNEFYDDMQWMALACLRLYDLTGNGKMKEYAGKLWDDIKTAWWEDETGGLAWKKDENRISRNACSNGPAAILAARLYARFGDEENLVWAEKIYEFETANLVDPVTGMVYDGMTAGSDGEKNVNRDWLFTYNAGTYIGACAELYRVTGKEAYLEQARRTAASSMEAFTTVYGVTKSEGQGDGGLFKGIYIRYLELLYEISEDAAIKEYILKNADTLMQKGCAPDLGIFGPEWNKIPRTPVQVTCQLSGVFLLEAAARLEKFSDN